MTRLAPADAGLQRQSAGPALPGRRALWLPLGCAALGGWAPFGLAQWAQAAAAPAGTPSIAPPAGLPAPEGAHRRPWPARQPTPGLRLPAWQGPDFDLAAQRGRVVLLNFWASWCEPCRNELPSLDLLAERLRGDGVVVATVNHRETDRALQRFMDSTVLTLPVLRDTDGSAARVFGVHIWPTTVVVGRDGRACCSIIGEVDWGGSTARQWLAPVLRARA
jgi:thiol-disulfide isomerase/thioredoxin